MKNILSLTLKQQNSLIKDEWFRNCHSLKVRADDTRHDIISNSQLDRRHSSIASVRKL